MRTSIHALPLAATATVSLILAACGDGSSATPQPAPPPTSSPAPTPSPSPTPAPTTASFNVEPCLTQLVAPGVTVASLVIPDTIKINLAAPAGFPNGRRLQDPVADITLAVLFLDLTRHPATAFASLPLNPAMNDRPFRADFPFLAAPQGNPPIASSAGTNFNFRTEARTAFVRVDRNGMPAVSTALVGGPQKNAFQDDDPEDEINGKWAPEFTAQLTLLANALSDDIQRAGFTICARPTS